jgi:hypothetical protein
MEARTNSGISRRGWRWWCWRSRAAWRRFWASGCMAAQVYQMTLAARHSDYAGGGGGGAYDGPAGTGGSSVGGNGGANANGSNGTDGRGGGGGGTGSGAAPRSGGNGGSGVVIIKIPSTKTATFTGGVTETNSTAGGYTTYVVTQTTTTNETVTFS